MLELITGNTDDKIVVTLTELVTISSPFFLFVFEHVTTKEVVAFVAGTDESPYPERYNQFTIDSSALFEDKPPGKWGYTVYEQAAGVNTNPANAIQPPLEYGQMILYKEGEFEYEQYNEPVTYKAYNG